MWGWFSYVVLLIVGLWHPQVARAVVSDNDPVGCAPALQFLVQHNVAEEEHLAQLPSNGSSICGGGACCVSGITEVLQSAGKASLGSTVQTAADKLYDDIISHKDNFYHEVSNSLTHSQHRAVKEFQNTYPRLASAARHVLHELYDGLRVGLSDFEDERALERALESFWDNLFPPVYHSALHARMPPFSKAYTECLRDAQREVKPWGSIPILVGEPLLRGLQSARLLLHALNVGANVINTARNIPIPEECGEASARLQYCGACHGALAPPCSDFCSNVARGCLAPLAEVDGAWSDLSGAVGRVQESLQAMKVSQLLHNLPEKLSEAVMVALERGPKLQKKVRRECHTPTHQDASTTTTNAEVNHHHHNHQDDVVEVEERSTNTILETSASALKSIETARPFWAGIADTHCENIATPNTNQCWNGLRVAPYTKMTAGVGISAQKYNPEVRVGRPDTTVYALADKLRRVRRELLSRLTWLPEAHAQHRTYPDDSGSGTQGDFARNLEGPYDEEDVSPYETYAESDDDDGAGSGHWEGSGGHHMDSEVIENVITPVKGGSSQATKPVGSAVQFKSNSIVLMCSFLCSIMYLYLG